MNSIAERLTRAFCLFHWLQVKPIPESVRCSMAYSALVNDLADLKVGPKDLASVSYDSDGSFEDSRLAFMVRYSGLTWSTCSVFCDAVDNPTWLTKGTALLVKTHGIGPNGKQGLSATSLEDFSFLRPSDPWFHQGRLRSFVIHWDSAQIRRIERFVRLTAARQGIDATVHNISQSDKFIAAIKATVGAQ